MAQSYFDMMMAKEISNKIVCGPPYLEACNSHATECNEHDVQVEALEAEIEDIKVKIVEERERMRQKMQALAIQKEIREQKKRDNLIRKNIADRKDFKKHFFKSKMDVSSGGGSGSVMRKNDIH